MVTKLISLLGCWLLLLAGPLQAQETPAQKELKRLLVERAVLYKDFEELNAQKSSFWGTQSKKDLRNIIDVLKNIIVKDNQIVEAVKRQGTEQVSNYRGHTREVTDQVYNLREENDRLTGLLRKAQLELAEKNAQLEELADGKKKQKQINNVFGLISLGLFVALVAVVVKRRRK